MSAETFCFFKPHTRQSSGVSAFNTKPIFLVILHLCTNLVKLKFSIVFGIDSCFFGFINLRCQAPVALLGDVDTAKFLVLSKLLGFSCICSMLSVTMLKAITMLTYKYKLASSVELDDLNAASASVWNECLKLKEMWNYAHGYRTTSKACELWMDKRLSKSQPLH